VTAKEHEGKRGGLAIRSDSRKQVEPIVHSLRQRRTAEYAGQYCDRGQPDLQGREKATRIISKTEGRTRSSMSARREAFQTSAARGHDRKLGHGEKAVQENEQHDHGDFKRSHLLSPRRYQMIGTPAVGPAANPDRKGFCGLLTKSRPPHIRQQHGECGFARYINAST